MNVIIVIKLFLQSISWDCSVKVSKALIIEDIKNMKGKNGTIKSQEANYVMKIRRRIVSTCFSVWNFASLIKTQKKFVNSNVVTILLSSVFFSFLFLSSFFFHKIHLSLAGKFLVSHNEAGRIWFFISFSQQRHFLPFLLINIFFGRSSWTLICCCLYVFLRSVSCYYKIYCPTEK